MEIILGSIVGAIIIILMLIALTLILNDDTKILKIVTLTGDFTIKFNPKDSEDKSQIDGLVTSLKNQLETHPATYFCQAITTSCDKQYIMFNLDEFKFVEIIDS